MKKILLPILLFCALTVAAQKQNVAVYVTGSQSSISKILGDQFVKAIAKSGNYTAIERTASFLAGINREFAYQQGPVDDNQISKLGKQFGAQLVCVIDITDAFDEKYISARLINVETAIIIKSSSAYSKLDNMNEVIKISENIAKELVGTTLTAKEKERQETKELITKALENGYIRVGNVYVLLTEFSSATYKEATKLAREYRFKGMAGWRLPNVSEAAMFYNKCCAYYYINHEFPYLGVTEYWCLDKHVISLGKSKGVSSNNSETNYYFLVRDAY